MTSTPIDASGTTLANWRSAAYNRWAFRHVDEFMATAPIVNRGARRPLPDDPMPRSFAGFRLRAAGGATLGLEEFLRQTRTDGLLVLVDGRVALEWRDEGMRSDTRHILMSASKSVVGLLCGALVERGLLVADAPVTELLPELAATGYAGATVRHLLDMRADPGLDAQDLRRYAAATNWEPAAPGAGGTGLHDFFRSLPARRGVHGGALRYLSANTDLLGWLMERATGRPFADLVSEILWTPLGAEHPGAVTLDRAGAARATGGLCASLRDFARIGLALLPAGPHSHAEPADAAHAPSATATAAAAAAGAPRPTATSAAWVADIAGNGDREAWANGEFARAFAGLAMRYRSGWYVLDDAPQTLFAMGIHGQHLFVDRANRLVIAKLSCQPDALDPVATGLTLRAVAEIRRCVGLAPGA